MKSYHTTPHQNQVPDTEKKIFLKNASKKDSHWDKNKIISRDIADIFEIAGDVRQRKKAVNVYKCCSWLLFGIHKLKMSNEMKHKLKDTRFCKARLCPICGQRRSFVWKGRMHKVYPLIRAKYPTIRFIHLTLTVKNCHVNDLKDTLKLLSESFKRLSDRMTKNKTIVGFMRSVEITREMENCNTCKGNYDKKSTCKNRENHIYTQNCHPHIHVLLAVPSNYFHSENYLTKEKWSDEWQKSLKCDYKPITWVSIIKPKKRKDGQEYDESVNQDELALASAVKEVAKYSVKVDEELLDSVLKDDEGKRWFLELDRQLLGTRSIGLGGCFKEFLKDMDPEDDEMIRPEDEKDLLEETNIFYKYSFKKKDKGYTRIQELYKDIDGILQVIKNEIEEKDEKESLEYDIEEEDNQKELVDNTNVFDKNLSQKKDKFDIELQEIYEYNDKILKTIKEKNKIEEIRDG